MLSTQLEDATRLPCQLSNDTLVMLWGEYNWNLSFRNNSTTLDSCATKCPQSWTKCSVFTQVRRRGGVNLSLFASSISEVIWPNLNIVNNFASLLMGRVPNHRSRLCQLCIWDDYCESICTFSKQSNGRASQVIRPLEGKVPFVGHKTF